MRYVVGLILLVFLGALGIFALQNRQVVTVQFWNWRLDAPVALVSIAMYLLGMLSGWNVVGLFRRSISQVTSEPRS